MKLMINVRLEENVVVTEGFTQEYLSKIQAVSEDVDIVVPQTVEETQSEIRDTEVVFGDFSPAMFAEARKLRWVQSIGSGIDGLLFDDFVESDITLTSAKGTVGTHLADHAWALILALTRGIHTALREKTWQVRMPIRARSWELAGMTLGVFGLGGTGVEVARRAQGFGMRTLALDSEEVCISLPSWKKSGCLTVSTTCWKSPTSQSSASPSRPRRRGVFERQGLFPHAQSCPANKRDTGRHS